MIPKELIDRINELAKLNKTVGLTDEQIEERKILREEYSRLFKEGFQETLLNLKVVDNQGKDVTPEKLKRDQEMKKNGKSTH